MPANFGLPHAIEGQSYSASVAGAAYGGVKPYRCTPVSLGEGSLAVHANCVISGIAPKFAGGTVGRITPIVFKLSDSGTPPQTVKVMLHLTIDTKPVTAASYNGVYTGRGTRTVTIDTPAVLGHAAQHHVTAAPIARLVVVNGAIAGHTIDISSLGWGSVFFTLKINYMTITTSANLRLDRDGVAHVTESEHGSGATNGATVKIRSNFSGTRPAP